MNLGYGNPATPSQDDKDTLADEAEQTIELWEEDAEMADDLPKVVTRHSQYHELQRAALVIIGPVSLSAPCRVSSFDVRLVMQNDVQQ